MNHFRPAAPGWRDVVTAYGRYLDEQRGVHSAVIGIRRFTRDIEDLARVPGALTVACLDEWMLRLSARGVKRSTVRAYACAARGFIRWLEHEGWVEADIASHIEAPLAWGDATIPAHFTWPEIQCLIDSVDGKSLQSCRDRAMLLLFCSCGLRAAEVARLAVEDVDLRMRTVRVRQRKTGDWLTLPLSRLAVAALGRYLHHPDRDSSQGRGALFLTWQGRPYRLGTHVSAQIRRIAEQAGLGRHRGAQAIRRAVGTRLVERGATLGQVALMLGHCDLQSSRRYVRVSIALLAEVADNYAEML